MKKIINYLLVITMMAFAVTTLVPRVAYADAKTSICEGVGIAGGGTGCAPKLDANGNPINGVENAISAAINILSIVVGVIAVIMVIIGGLKYIMSSGDANNVTSAKNTILYAIIGLVVVSLAQVIVRFVLNKV